MEGALQGPPTWRATRSRRESVGSHQANVPVIPVTPRSFGGIGGITDEDRGYGGSRFSDVCEALFAIPYRRTWGAGGEPPPPVHPVTAMHIDRRLVSDGNTHALILPSTDVLLLLGGPV